MKSLKEGITTKRIGPHKDSGYRGELIKLQHFLGVRRDEVVRRIAEGEARIGTYTAAVRGYHQQFGIIWLEGILSGLERISAETHTLRYDHNSETYLSRARFEELQEEAAGVFSETDVVSRNREALRTLSHLLHEAHQRAGECIAVVSKKLGEELNDHYEEIEQRAHNLAFDSGFVIQREAIVASIEAFVERIAAIYDLVSRTKALEKRYAEVMKTAEILRKRL